MNAMLTFLKPYKKSVIFAVVFMLIDVVCTVLEPQLVREIIAKGIGEETGHTDIKFIITTGLLMILVAVIAIAGGCFNARHSARAGVGFGADLRKTMFAKMQTFSFKNIDAFSTESLTIRLTNDITQIQNVIIMSMRIMIRAPLLLVFAVFMSININARLSWIFAVTIPILAGVFLIISRKALPRFEKMQTAVDRLNGNVRENLTNVRVAKSFVRQDFEKEKFTAANDNLRNASENAIKLVITTMPFMMLVMNMTILGVLFFGGQQIIGGTMRVADLSAFMNYIMHILISIMMAAMLFIMFTRATASYKRILEVLETQSEIRDEKDARDHGSMTGEVEFDNVSFKYDMNQKEYILKNICFCAKPGEVVAIMGGTGSGKSSLVQLIARLYDATEGEIRIDGKPLKSYTLESLRRHIGVVMQKNTLFSGTVRDNLKWGDENAGNDEIISAAKNAQAHDFIMSLPGGYDSRIEQGGVNLSGGQRQRLCIARAMLKKPSILILDDSTSAVDTATEGKIRRAFDSALKETTTFIIAQRISSVKDADKIIILEDGGISDCGTHDELIKTSEAYQEIYYSQQDKEVG